MPTPPRLSRRAGHGGLSLLVLAASSTLLWSTASGTASAAPADPEPDCSAGICTVRFSATDAVQTYTVPVGVTWMSATLSGAAGGSTQDPAKSGLGGRSTGTFTVRPGDDLSLVVGGAGNASDTVMQGAPGGYGGGGAGGDNVLTRSGGASGGGGSFVFGPDDVLLLAAGGGGGAIAGYAGGAGGAAGAAAGGGADSDLSVVGGEPGTLDANGLGGLPNGGAGTGDATSSTTLPVGGRGGDASSPFPPTTHLPGAGGGGGYHAGGGGGGPTDSLPETDTYGAGGGGGAGFAAKGVTDVSGAAGVEAGDGTITLSYSDANQIVFTSDPDGAVVGKKGYQVSTESTGTEPVVFSIDKATTNGACTIAGSAVTFVHVGICAISADQPADRYHGSGHHVQTFPVDQGDQTITFTPVSTNGTVGDELTLEAKGGGSDSPVEIAVAPGSTPGACELNGTTLTLTGDGTCAVVATQAGNADYKDAEPASQQIEVALAATKTEMSFDVDTPVYGQPVTASVRVRGASAGTVQLLVDGDEFGDPITVNPDGKASVPLPYDLNAGGHLIAVAFSPTDAQTYAGSTAELTLPVAQAKTKAKLTVRSDTASVTVTTVVPGAGTAEGSVVFIVGDSLSDPVQLVHGKATFAGSIPAGTEVNVVYDGDENFAGSSDSTSRKDPTITAKVTSGAPRSSHGWYRAPVVVKFTCTEGSAPLTDDCPAPVTLTEDGPAQTVVRTITAADGGIATATVTGLNLDSTKPVVSVYGVTEGQRFFAEVPDAGCEATDALSGVQRCVANRKIKNKVATYTAAAVDQAGNVSILQVHATTYTRGITNALYVDGAYQVHAGQAYTLVAKSSKQPRVMAPSLVPKKPRKNGEKFTRTGADTWALGYTIPTSVKPGKDYYLGIRDSRKHVIKIHVVA